MFCIRIRYAACAGAASTTPSSSRRAAVTRSSASRARIHWFRAAAMAALRWAAIVGPLTSMTLAPCARAIATVSSVEPPSATMTSSAQRSDASASAICHASLSVGITTVRGSEAGGTGGRGGTGGARSGMTSSGCERSGLRLGCWSRGCPLIIQHAFRRHTVVMTTLLLAHDFPPLGGGIARLHGELARRYPAGELIVSTPQDPDAGDVDAQYNGAVDRLPIGRRTTKSLPGLLLWSRRAASLARQHHVRFVHCGNVKPAGYPARWVLERCRVPYSVFLYGADVLSEQHKIRQSVFKRRTARAVFGGAAALVAISGWTRDLVLSVLGDLGLDGHGQRTPPSGRPNRCRSSSLSTPGRNRSGSVPRWTTRRRWPCPSSPRSPSTESTRSRVQPLIATSAAAPPNTARAVRRLKTDCRILCCSLSTSAP